MPETVNLIEAVESGREFRKDEVFAAYEWCRVYDRDYHLVFVSPDGCRVYPVMLSDLSRRYILKPAPLLVPPQGTHVIVSKSLGQPQTIPTTLEEARRWLSRAQYPSYYRIVRVKYEEGE